MKLWDVLSVSVSLKANEGSDPRRRPAVKKGGVVDRLWALECSSQLLSPNQNYSFYNPCRRRPHAEQHAACRWHRSWERHEWNETGRRERWQKKNKQKSRVERVNHIQKVSIQKVGGTFMRTELHARPTCPWLKGGLVFMQARRGTSTRYSEYFEAALLI